MFKFLQKQLIKGFITLFIAVSLTFLILRLMPGDPTTMLIDPRMSEAARQRLLIDFGLDKSLITQYFLYLKQLFYGNLGVSFVFRAPVSEIIRERLPWTLALMGITQIITIAVGIPLGVIAAYKRGKLTDQIINALSILGMSIFVPWLGIMLLFFFGYILPIFPVGGGYTPGLSGWEYFLDVGMHFILPVLTLTIIYLANYILFTRASMVDVLNEDYIRTARSKGMKESRVIWKHGARNAMVSTVTVAGMLLGRMVGGAVLTETVYAYPGVGRMIYDAVGQQDFPLLQGSFIVLAITVIVMNILADFICAYLDPRIKME